MPSPTDNSPPALIPDDKDSENDESAYGDPLPPCESGSERENTDDSWHLDHPSLEHDLENEHFQCGPDRDMPTVEPDTAPAPEALNIPADGGTAPEGASPLKGQDSEG